MSDIKSAFHTILNNATPAEGVFVTLYVTSQWYGGPEEGGWWGTTTEVEAYQRFDTMEEAEASMLKIEAFAEELTKGEKEAHDRAMRRECEWCEARGIDPADHPSGEPDGPDTYEVHVEKVLGEHRYSSDPYYS